MSRHTRRDSRLCKRFQVENGTIALDSVYGEIIDISFGGLSFRYHALDDMMNRQQEFGIIFGGEELFFDNIPLRNVSDMVLDVADEDAAIEVRRRCMAFGELTREELARLAHFIKHHAVKE